MPYNSGTGVRLRDWISFSGSEEREPDRAEDQYRKAGGDDKQSQHRRSRLGLPRFGRRFDDLALLSRCHGALDFLCHAEAICSFGAGYRGQRVISDPVPALGPGNVGGVSRERMLGCLAEISVRRRLRSGSETIGPGRR